MTKIQIKILSFFLGIPIFIGIIWLLNYLLIVDNGYGYVYRFPQLCWLLDFFFEGHHLESNLLYFIITFSLGIFIAYKLLFFIFKPTN